MHSLLRPQSLQRAQVELRKLRAAPPPASDATAQKLEEQLRKERKASQKFMAVRTRMYREVVEKGKGRARGLMWHAMTCTPGVCPLRGHLHTSPALAPAFFNFITLMSLLAHPNASGGVCAAPAGLAIDEEQVRRLEAAFCGEFDHTEKAQRYKAEIRRLQAKLGVEGTPLRAISANTPGTISKAEATKVTVAALWNAYDWAAAYVD